MLIKRRRFWFTVCHIILEDSLIDEVIQSGIYDSITILSYKEHMLPHFTVVTKNTALLDISDPKKTFTQFSHTTRNEIRKTYNEPRLAFVSEDKNTKELYTMYCAFELSQKRVPIDYNEFAKFTFFGAYLDGELISAISVVESMPYIRIRSIFSKRLNTLSDKEKYKMIGYASRRLMYEICEWGHTHHFVSLDLASVNLTDTSKKGITGFKMSFGGQHANEYTYTYKSTFFVFFERFVWLKLIWVKIMLKLKNA